MSYILEALKKSEQERKLADEELSLKEESSDVPTSVIYANSKAAPESNRFINTLSLGGLILVSFAVIFYLVLNTSPELSAASDTKTMIALGSQLEVEEVKVVDEVVSTLKEIEPAVVKTAEAEPVIIEPVVIESVVIKSAESEEQAGGNSSLGLPMPIESAENQLTRSVSGIEITSHIYSSQAKRRSVVANGMRLKEGDLIEKDIYVYEITHQGMIIRVNNNLLIIDRSRGWGQ